MWTLYYFLGLEMQLISRSVWYNIETDAMQGSLERQLAFAGRGYHTAQRIICLRTEKLPCGARFLKNAFVKKIIH